VTKNQYIVTVNVNSNEYISEVVISAKGLIKSNENTIVADGVIITFGETIEGIYKVEVTKVKIA
jgi:hypothetical protein